MTTRGAHRRRLPLLLAALATVLAMLLSACSSDDPVVVTVTTTPGQPMNSGQSGQSGGGESTAGQQGGADQGGSNTDGSNNGAANAGGQDGASKEQTSRQLADAIRVVAKPKFGSKDIGPADPVTITVFSGKIQNMTVTADDGTTIKGEIGGDKATYTLTERMAYNTTYTFAGTAIAPDNSTKKISGKLSTVKPESTVLAQVNLPEGKTVGVGAPIIITFYKQIQDKAAAEKALKVTTDKGPIEGSWGWVQDEDFQGAGHLQSQVHFRPKEYWPAHTKVTLHANLRGVNYGNGWGREDITRHFTIGRSLVIVAKVSTKHLVVWKDGEIYRNYPVSYGRESEPGRTTTSGIHIVQDKKAEVLMSNPEYGYYDLPEKWAIRINNNGEFIHHNAAVEASGLLGKENVSHGCVNMGEANAKELFDMVLYGDPVEVSGTSQRMGYQDYVYDWALTWPEWQTLSALR